MAVWMLTQMKRWGYIKGDVGYRGDADARVPRDRSEKKHMASWR